MTQADEEVDLEALERQFDRIGFLFTRVDAKVNAILAIASGQIAIASVGIGGDWKHLSLLLPAILFLASMTLTMINLYRCTFPEVKRGGGDSLVYFAQIARLSREKYVQRAVSCSVDEWKKDVATQTWKTAHIAQRKFKYLKQATIFSLASLVPWTWLLVLSTWNR
ncbi:MAG TPA: Pycsar system effector family protein [Sphingomicrobium sp.]|jgi:hypothetical protein|nr:Pycsar system effector family protein [Sphingomicrobium sp.]